MQETAVQIGLEMHNEGGLQCMDCISLRCTLSL